VGHPDRQLIRLEPGFNEGCQPDEPAVYMNEVPTATTASPIPVTGSAMALARAFPPGLEPKILEATPGCLNITTGPSHLVAAHFDDGAHDLPDPPNVCGFFF